MMIHFEKVPPEGTTVSIDGQVYEFRGAVNHTKQDGGSTTLLVWETLCSACRNSLLVKSTMKSNGLSRRCGGCAHAGKPVKGKRGRKCQITVTLP